jgi:outer membrane protein insertion porin family
VNTNKNNKEFVLSTSDKLFINNSVNHGYSVNYKENDFSKSQSYKLNTFSLDTSFNYKFSNYTYHTLAFGYSLKEYIVTDATSAPTNIKSSEGESISFNITNDFTRNTLNSFIKPSKGNFVSFVNFIETPSSSANGFVKNIITGKKYYSVNKNIFSAQGKLGNILSLNDSEILSDNKFSLGGKWLRGFDAFGAGPRNSRTSYIGGNNILALKLDFSKPISLNEQNPIYVNLFNDYGTVWGNKNAVTFSDQDLRVSYGFGINYYSPIGPIGFSWGFPLVDKDYDIKRMFLFSIGNIN